MGQMWKLNKRTLQRREPKQGHGVDSQWQNQRDRTQCKLEGKQEKIRQVRNGDEDRHKKETCLSSRERKVTRK